MSVIRRAFSTLCRRELVFQADLTNTAMRGFAGVGGVCTAQNTAIVEWRGLIATIQVATHELGHK